MEPAIASAAENKLLSRCRQGNPAAWDELFNQHYAAAGRFVFQLGYAFTHEDVEEICQETFFSVVRNLKHFNGRSQFQTWLFRIAYNKARDYHQRQTALKRGGRFKTVPIQTHDPEQEPVDPPSPALAPDQCLLTTERLELVRQALSRMAEPFRLLLELRYFADLSYEEIARALRMHPKTVSSQLSRSLDKLEVELTRLTTALETSLPG